MAGKWSSWIPRRTWRSPAAIGAIVNALRDADLVPEPLEDIEVLYVCEVCNVAHQATEQLLVCPICDGSCSPMPTETLQVNA